MTVECIAIIGAIATIIAGLGGSSLGAFCAYKTGMKLVHKTNENAVSLAKRQEFNRAATEFRNAFLPEIIFLTHNAKVPDIGASSELYELLRQGYISRHLKAFEIFKDCLPTKEREDIDKAWEEYCNKESGQPHFFAYAEPVNVAQKDKERTFYLAKLNDLLKFAEPK